MFSFLRELFPSAGSAVMTVDVEDDCDDDETIGRGGRQKPLSRRRRTMLQQKEESKDESESLVSPTASNVSQSSGSAFVAFGSPDRESSNDTAPGSPTMSPPTDQLLGAVSTAKQVFSASFFTRLGMFKPIDSEMLGGGDGGEKPKGVAKIAADASSRIEAALTKNKMWDSRVDKVGDSDTDTDADADADSGSGSGSGSGSDSPNAGKTSRVVTALELSSSSSLVKGPTSPARIKATSAPAPKVSSSWHDSAEEKHQSEGGERPAAVPAPAPALAVESSYHASLKSSRLGRIFLRG